MPKLTYLQKLKNKEAAEFKRMRTAQAKIARHERFETAIRIRHEKAENAKRIRDEVKAQKSFEQSLRKKSVSKARAKQSSSRKNKRIARKIWRRLV